MTDKHQDFSEEIDADGNGHLATAIFVGVILVILLFIYGLAMAA